MTGRRAYGAAFASGVLLSFAFPEPSVAPLAWVALVPLLFSLAREQSRRRGALLGASFGAGFFGTLLVWVSIVGWVAWFVLIVMSTAFMAAFGALCVLLYRRDRRNILAHVLVPPLVWVAVVEHLRSLGPVGGFTWGQLAQSQHDMGFVLRPASIGGGWLVAFLIVMVNALIAEALRFRTSDRHRSLAFILLAGLVLTTPVIIPANDATGDPIRIALVQGNVPRDFQGTSFEKELAITRSHRELTEGLAGRGIDLVLWPESAVGIDLLREPTVAKEVSQAARAGAAPMIVGANQDVDRGHYRVTALHVSPEGQILDTYVKTHLVPFGEYVPIRSLLGWLPILDQVPRDAVRADEVKLFDVAGNEVAPVLSFEGDFGALVRRRMDDGGRLLVVATNTSTWGRSWASAQHLAFSQVRAAETGVWVAHVAISGISGVVTPDGDVAESLPLWTRGTIVRDVRFAEDTTFYARTGEWVPMLSYIVLLGLVASQIERGLREWRTPQRPDDGATREEIPFE
jgi:apolipoprotein N-acyltransferase